MGVHCKQNQREGKLLFLLGTPELNYLLLLFSCFRIDERVILMVAFFISAFGYFCIIPMTDEPPKVAQLLGIIIAYNAKINDLSL